MTNNKSLSLYIHIPFCVKKCDYCAFYSLPNQSESVKQAYFDALVRQIEFFPNDRPIGTVYFGGGTPPMLGIDRLCKLISLIKHRFTLTDGCEITVEVNPKTVDLYSLNELRSAGANRLSIGVQSADDSILASIGRIHTFADAQQCISDARLSGFDNISADIIFALPNQTFESFVEGVDKIMSTNVDHISAYSLQIEEGTPIFEKRNLLDFPDEENEERQYNAILELAEKHGFRHYEISSFAKDGHESRHNLNYWSCGEYFGFGAAAHSYYNGKRFSAVNDVNRYIEQSAISLYSPTDYDIVEPIPSDEAEEERIMLGLRTAYGAMIPEKAYGVAQRIADMGYGTFKDGVLKLNSKGFRVSNAIIAEILT